MNRLLKLYFPVILVTFLMNIVSFGQDLYVDVKTTNNYPGVGDKFKITYTLRMKSGSLRHSGIQITKPSFKGFNLIDEGAGQPGFSFGSMHEDMAVYLYEAILQATREGTFQIPPCEFKLNNKSYKSGVFTIQVGEGDPNVKIEKKVSDLFTRIDVSKKEIYKGEKVLVTYKIFSRYQSLSLDDITLNSVNGAWSEELEATGKNWPVEQTTINGHRYQAHTLKKEILYPQKIGTLEIPSFSSDYTVGRTFFNPGKSISVKSNSLNLKVLPLPSPAPNSFENQVGKNYSLDVNYSTDNLKSGEPIDLKIKISGSGNLKQLSPLTIDVPHDFEIFDPEIKENIKLSSSGASGYKEFNYLIIPRHHGNFEIPEITFSYFDLSSSSYKTLKAKAQSITVLKGEQTTSTSVSSLNQEDVRLLNEDLRHINENTTLYKETDFVHRSIFQYSAYGILSFLLAGLFVFRKFLNKEKDYKEIAQKGASKSALKRLKLAQQLLDEKKDNAFFEELYASLIKYLCDKFSIGQSELSKENIRVLLTEKGYQSSVSDTMIHLLEQCEMAKFAPTTHASAENKMEEAKQLILEIEKNG